MANDNDMLRWLENRHKEIMQCENDALKALDTGDIAAYREKMHAKAANLARIHVEAGSLLDALPAGMRAALADELAGFAQAAQTALSLDSVFYMSALLYPDDHKPGEPDNLTRCIEKFRNRIS